LDFSTRDAWLVLFCRGLRAFSDGALAILLPLYLFTLGYNAGNRSRGSLSSNSKMLL
jgi:hypothetical protein